MEPIYIKHRESHLARLKKFVCHDMFEDVCLNSRLYGQTTPIKRITHATSGDDVTYDEAMALKYEDVHVGMAFGPLWSKHWFRLDIEIPVSWVGEEVVLRWMSNTECQVWSAGVPLQGLSCMKQRHYFTITPRASIDDLVHTVFIESSCNGVYTDHNAAPPDFTATLTTAEIKTMDRDVFSLKMDLQIMYELITSLPPESSRIDEILMVANDVINSCVLGHKQFYKSARAVARQILSQKNGDGGHVIHAVGYANIDTAWLWPYRKTPMKCVSSWSAVMQVMEKYPFKLAFTQPQQLVWVKEKYPDWYRKIKNFIDRGLFIPTGSTWIEMDANLPNGECLIRQFLYGQRFLKKEYGLECTDLWILDSFGYSAQLPQIMLHCDVTRFVSIKLSWNSVNTFPHSTFWWQGLGGHKVLAHLPPGNNYHKEVSVKEILEVERLFRDGGRSTTSLFLFGHGNAGLGPTEEMLEKLERLKDLRGLPRVRLSSPEEFYKSVESDTSRLCTWVGELYLERHQGTYTSQAPVKKRNRRAEFLLHDMDLWSTIAAVKSTENRTEHSHPGPEIERIWKLLMISQFHDVLPGSAHQEVYKDFNRNIDDLSQSAESIFQKAIDVILASKISEINNGYVHPDVKDKTTSVNSHQTNGKLPADSFSKQMKSAIVVNSLSWCRKEVIAVPPNLEMSQLESDAKETLVLVEAPSCSLSIFSPCQVLHPVSVLHKDGMIHLKNHLLTVSLDSSGRICRLWKPGCSRNFLRECHLGSQFVIYDDFPLYRDAWDSLDYNLQTRKAVEDVIEKAIVIMSEPHRAVVRVTLKISSTSHIQQDISLDTECPYIRFKTKVSWHERHKFLKVEFPTSVISPVATYEIQFGHLQRATHYNTSWDSAKYEVCGHKWMVLQEHGRGLAVLNDCKYGHSCVSDTMVLSLLRAPTAPDPHSDVGDHEFTFGVMPFTGNLQDAGVIQQAYNLNSPLTLHRTNISLDQLATTSYFSLDTDQVILETVKIAEDNPSAMVLRLYETFGGCAVCRLMTSLPVRDVYRCNGLEKRLPDSVSFVEPGIIELELGPFQILSLFLHF